MKVKSADTKLHLIIPHLPVSSRVLGCEEKLYFERWTPTNLANQVK